MVLNFKTLLQKKNSNGWYYCRERTQPIGTSLCGEYCMYYALMKCTGYEMSKIIKSMNPENVLLVVQRAFYDGFINKCPLLQNCVNVNDYIIVYYKMLITILLYTVKMLITILLYVFCELLV